MKRRAALSGVIGLLSAGGRADARQGQVHGKIGYLHQQTTAADHPTLKILGEAWRKLGYVEGETVLLRAAQGDGQRVPALVNELVAQGAGVLIVVGPVAVRAATRATRLTPIVAIDLDTDPVQAGYATSLARPGGNVTGLFMDQPSLAGKWIDLLREAVPGLQRLAILWDRGSGIGQLEIAKTVARAKGFDAIVLEFSTMASYSEGLSPLRGKPVTGIVTLISPRFTATAAAFAPAAQALSLPTISFLRAHARSGVLMSYGPIQGEYFARAVILADRILKGAKAAELPIEGPDRFELVINRKTATAMGLAIPPSLLLRADEVIE
jgi:putative tryptophan/tyrosine transport system substrate-binding protein